MGTGARRPVLFIGHLDVVDARREDWSFDPFQFREADGWFYGRGTSDMKADDALLLANFIRLKQENYRPDRDLILALTADEEGGNDNGIEWLVKNRRDLDRRRIRDQLRCRRRRAQEGQAPLSRPCRSPRRLT